MARIPKRRILTPVIDGSRTPEEFREAAKLVTGTIHRKRSDTKVGTLRQTYGPDFAKGFRSDAKLGTVLKRTGAKSLDEYRRSS
jgi:hypothetical protein